MDINYSLELLQKNKASRNHIYNELLLLKNKYCIEKCNVIELGCGLGENLSLFKEDNIVKGVEGLADAVNTARLQGLEIIQANLEYPIIEIPNASQDWILCLDVLEHLVKPFNLLLEIKRILKDNGKAILNVPNHLELRGRLKILFGSGIDVHNFFPEYNEWDNPHLRFFTHSGYRKMIESAGFSLLDDRSYRFNSLPLSNYINKIGVIQLLIGSLAKQNPSLFCSGFFVVIEKSKF